MRSDIQKPVSSQPDPVWPGFPPRALPISDPLGLDAVVENERGPHQFVHPGVPETDALRRVLASISRSVDPTAAVRTALRESLATTGATVGSLWLFQRDGSIARAAHSGLSGEYLRTFAGTNDWREVQEELSQLADVEVLDDGDLPWLPEHHRQMTPLLGLRSMAVIPLRTRGLRMGSIVLGHGQPGWFRDHSLSFLRTLAEMVATSLDNARLISELEDALQSQAELVRSAHDAIAFYDTELRLTEANPALGLLLGVPRERLIGRSLLEFLARTDAAAEETFRRVVQRGVPLVGELLELRDADGALVPVVINGSRVVGHAHETRGAVLTMRDERQAHPGRPPARGPHANESRILASLDTGVALVSGEDLVVLEHNPAFARLVSCAAGDEALQGSLPELLPGGENAALVTAARRAARDGRRVAESGLEVRAAGGGTRYWNVVVAPIPRDPAEPTPRLVLTLVDVTERRALDERYRHAQKMEAVGTLAGGIAHEFNNLLTAILGQVSLALFDLPPEHPLVPGLRDSEKAALRAADLTRQLLEFGRRSPVRLRPTDLRDVVRNAIPLVRASLDPRIEIEEATADEPWVVQADAPQLGQVLMNLCLNARDAMPAGGRLRIGLRNVAGDPPGSGPGDHVELSVADTGDGMSPEVRARMFEPFYTTKGPDRGTGLGLAVAHSIVEQHGGWIACESRPGEGTRMRVCLPRSASALAASPPAPGPGRGETVLVVDDEEAVRNLALSVLERNGYRVLLAADGAEAVAVFRAHRDRIALVLLDLTMPQLSGAQALAELRALSPEVRIVLTSGYGVGEDLMAATDASDGFLPKPYSPTQVAAAVRNALDTAR